MRDLTPRSSLLNLAGLAAAAGALVLATSCNPTAPSVPATATPLTETFTATVVPHGANVFPFPVAGAGSVTATLSTISPDSGLTLALNLGTWNGATCAVQFTTNPAAQGASVTANANAAGNLCVQVTDSNGAIKDHEDITITVTHF